MEKRNNGHSIGKKVFTMILLCVLLAIATTSVVSIIQLKKTSKSDLKNLEENVKSDYDKMITYEVESLVSMLDPINKRIENGELSKEEGMDLAADIIRNSRYGESGYFWVDDFEGNNVVLLGLDIEGTNRLGFKDANGYPVMQVMVDLVKSEGRGFIDFWYPKKGETEASPKRGYVMAYEPFNWIIGTGNYVDDLETIVSTQRTKNEKNLYDSYMYLIIISVLIIILSIIISIVFSKKLQLQLSSIKNAMDKIADYNLNIEEEKSTLSKFSNKQDEIGNIIHSILRLNENLSTIVSNITVHAGNTAATAEELTATAQNTNEMAREVASAVENIADGATGQAQDTARAADDVEKNSNAISEMVDILEELKLANANIDVKKDEGKEALDGLNKLSDENKAEAGFINQIILETNESAESISKASEMIQSIADQTNLLALNAAIDIAYSI